MSKSSRITQTQLLVAGLAAAAVTCYFLYSWKKENATKDDDENAKADRDLLNVPLPDASRETADSGDSFSTPVVSNRSMIQLSEKELHAEIEALDKEGKALFKAKKFLEAAEIFTKAVDLIEQQDPSSGDTSSKPKMSQSLSRQIVTLMNNRSAMYEKGSFPELALEDCKVILEKDPTHTKARTRMVRILESQEMYQEAIVQVCALQLQFMQTNRAQLRMGVPLTPPIPQQKLEDLLGHILPDIIERQYKLNQETHLKKSLPSKFTLTQLLKSFKGYNQWMKQAAESGTIDELSDQINQQSNNAVNQVTLYWKRGRRNVYEQKYEAAVQDFEKAYSLLEADSTLADQLLDDTHCRLLEWVGMTRHWKYDLKESLKCYEKCSELEPLNTSLLVKRAGVHMDNAEHDEALKLFDMALGLDSHTTDALMHRANLRMLQQKVDDAKADLMECLRLQPDHLMARLRLSTVLMAVNDLEGANHHLSKAQDYDPKSSEVHSYRGEMYFAQGNLADARVEFDKAIELEPSNPTPYVNAALAIMNSPSPTGGPPDAPAAIKLLETAIEADPQFHAAYMNLGQLKLATATNLIIAREVVSLYEKALTQCRTREELKDICGVHLLTVAQVDAATMLGMETFSMT